MAVQYRAVSAIPPLHIVLYCLTQPEFRRYSSLTLCQPYPARGGNERRSNGSLQRIAGKGNPCSKHGPRIRNPPLLAKPARNGTHISVTTDRWPLELTHCSN